MSILERLRQRSGGGLIERLRERAGSDGVVSTVVDHSGEVIDALVTVAEEPGVPGVDKKHAVLSMLGELLDEVFAKVNSPGPDWLVEPAAKRVLLWLAGYLIDKSAARLFPKPAAT